MTLKIWLFLTIGSAVLIFATTYFLTNFFISEMVGKIKKDSLDDIKTTAFKIALTPLLILICAPIYFLNAKFYIQTVDLAIISATAMITFTLAVYCGTRLIEHKNIESERKTIEKEITADGFGTLLTAVTPTLELGSPLLTYLDDEKNALRVTCEDRGMIIGSPGFGKTTYLILQLIDWMRSGKSFVATDVKPEIWGALKYNGMFERFGYKDWVLNPTDIKSDHYNIFSEVKDSAEMNEILAVIIQDDSPETAVFTDTARRLLKAVLIELGDKASLPNAQRFINGMDDNAELLKTLRQSENETVSSIAIEITRTAKSDNLLASVMTSVSKAFDFLDDERIRVTTADNADGFYLKDVLMKPKQAVFLQFDQQYRNSTSTLFGALVAHTMRILQANQRRDDVFVALDEIINCAQIPKFTDLLNTIRSAKMPTFLYLQSLEGLNRLYGANADKIFLGASNYKVVFRVDDQSTTNDMSKSVGMTKTTFYTYAENTGTSASSAKGTGTSSSSSISTSTKMDYIIEADAFSKLPMYNAVVLYNGAFGTLEMPKYWEIFDCKRRIIKATPSFLEEKMD